jgi:hypothetical protein
MMRVWILVAVLGVLLLPGSASAQAPGASEACKSACEQRCQGTRLSKGECLLRCTSRCPSANKKKK